MIPKTKILGTRATPEIYAEAQAAAHAKGKTVSEWLYRLVKNSLRQTKQQPGMEQQQ